MDAVGQSTLSKRSPLPAGTYGLAELASLLDISYTTAHELAQRGELPVPAIRLGRQYKFSKRAVHALLGLDADDAA